MSESSKFIRYAVILFLVGLSGYCFFNYLLPIAAPFIVAYLFSRIIRPFSLRIRSLNSHFDKPATVLLLLVITGCLFFILRFAVYSIAGQFSEYISVLLDRMDSVKNPLSVISAKIVELGKNHLWIKKLFSNGFDPVKIENVLSQFIKDNLSELGSTIARFASSVLSDLPGMMISIVITFSAVFYFSLDRGEAATFFSDIISQKTRSSLKRVKEIVSKTIAGYFKTYFIMMLIVFTILYLGFTVMGISFPLVKAMLIALVDLLPVLGVGAVIVPWSVFDFMTGDSKQSIGLLILLAVITITRELVEPRIVGNNIGIPPVVALISAYSGIRLCGVAGMILFPILSSVALTIVKETEKTPTEVGVEEWT